MVPLEKKVLFAVWMVSKPESFLAAGDRFGISKSTGHFIFKEVVESLAQQMNTFISWPQMAKYRRSAAVSVFIVFF